MPYNPRAWVNDVTETLADYMNNIEAGIVAALRGDANLSDLANAGTARTNLGLDTAATSPATAFAPSSGITPAAVTGTAVVTGDARLSDARTPTAHGHLEADVTNLTTDLAAKTDKATLTAKGDLYVASSAGVITRLGVGTNGQVLTADSTAATGTKWAAAAGGNIGSGQYLAPPQTSDTITSTAQGTNYMRAIPLDLPRAVTVTAMGLYVSTAGAAGALVRLGIYDDASGVPTNLIRDAGTAATTTTNVKEVVISPLAVPAGRVWLVACTQGAQAGFIDMQNSPRLTNQTNQGAAAGNISGSAGYYNSAGGISGAFPAAFGAVTGNVATGLMRIYLKVA